MIGLAPPADALPTTHVVAKALAKILMSGEAGFCLQPMPVTLGGGGGKKGALRHTPAAELGRLSSAQPDSFP